MRDIILEFEDLTYRILEIDTEPKKKGKFKKFLKAAGLVGAGALGTALAMHKRLGGGEAHITPYSPPSTPGMFINT